MILETKPAAWHRGMHLNVKPALLLNEVIVADEPPSRLTAKRE